MSEDRVREHWEGPELPLQSPSPTYRSSADGRLVTYSRPCRGISAEAFLAHARGQQRFYWEDVRDDIIFAGFGVAVHLMAWGEERYQHIHEQAGALFGDAALLGAAPSLAAPRLFGGFAFRHDFTPDYAWSNFHPAHFVLPHYQFVQSGDGAWLTINALLAPDEDPHEALPQLQEAADARYWLLQEDAGPASVTAPAEGHGVPQSMRYPLPYETWEQQIGEARKRFETTPLKKVVLSRVCELRFARHVDVEGALRYLNAHYADCYRFLFEPQPGHAFFGATPELLAKVEGTKITSMALAGSIGRSDDPRQDEALGQQLLNSAKDRYEHQVVVMSLLERLAPLTAQLEISPQPGVYKLRNIQHLFTPVRGELLHAQGILPLVQVLHPTPALGGSPRRLALSFIRQAEPVPRGWYAAPLGWVDYRLDGAFAVAIRSAVSQQRRVWLYAGSGIVADSDPRKEWDETALKFEPMLRALGVGPVA